MTTKSLKDLEFHPVVNESIVNEEKMGYGNKFTTKHVTHFKNPEVRNRIVKMSIMKIIN